MKIGDYVTVDEVMNQSECRWVVLVDLTFDNEGDIEGGTISFIADTKVEAGKVAAKLNTSGTEAFLMSGTWETLCVGGVFVE